MPDPLNAPAGGCCLQHHQSCRVVFTQPTTQSIENDHPLSSIIINFETVDPLRLVRLVELRERTISAVVASAPRSSMRGRRTQAPASRAWMGPHHAHVQLLVRPLVL